MNMFDLAMRLLSNDPRVSNNPQTKQMIDTIRRRDNVEGEKLANNLLNTYGVSKEEGIKQARTFFGL